MHFNETSARRVNIYPAVIINFTLYSILLHFIERYKYNTAITGKIKLKNK